MRTANTVGVVPWKRGSTRENVSVVVAREPKGCVLRLSVWTLLWTKSWNVQVSLMKLFSKINVLNRSNLTRTPEESRANNHTKFISFAAIHVSTVTNGSTGHECR